jgi:hypothetical protein
MAFDYTFHDDNTLRIEVPVEPGQTVPTFARPFYSGGVIRAVISGVPTELVRLFA